MEPAVPSAATPEPAEALAQAPVPGQVPLPLPGLLSPSPLLSSRQEVDGSERRACLWRPWLSSTNDQSRQAAGGVMGAEDPKTDSQFHHPVRLFWPKSCSFDYLYSDGETLLQSFPVQATINLYEDLDSEKEEEEEEEEFKEEEEKEADEKGPEGCVEISGSATHRATAQPCS
ncbi:Protein ripply1 [Manis javanica]|nr:Protein ripply1 [Manis javanica]